MYNTQIQQKQQGSILRNASFLFTAHIIGRILSFILTIMLPRYLTGGFDDLGKYFFALWLTNLLSSVTELGLQTPLIRDIATDRSKAPLMMSNAFVIRIVLSIVNFLILIILVILKYPGEVGALIYIIGLSEIINSIAQLFRCTFRAYEDMGYEALGVIVERFVVFIIGISVVVIGYGIVAFCVVVLIASIVNLTLTFLIMILKFNRINLGLVNVRLSIDLLKKSLPYALGGLLYMAYFRVDGILLKNIMGVSGDIAMGWYGTGYSFVNALTIIPGAFMSAIFPVMSRAFSSAPSELDSIYTRSLKLMFMVGLPIVIGVAFLADDIVLIIYPPSRFGLADREALSIILRVLIWSGMLLFLNTVIITLYRATDARKAFATVTAISLCANIISNLILIPKYSYLGASISMVISEALFLVCGSFHIQRYISKINDFRALLKVLFASLVLTLVLFIFRQFMLINLYINFTLTVIVGFAIYAIIIFAIRAVTPEDIKMIRKQHNGKPD